MVILINIILWGLVLFGIWMFIQALRDDAWAVLGNIGAIILVAAFVIGFFWLLIISVLNDLG